MPAYTQKSCFDPSPILITKLASQETMTKIAKETFHFDGCTVPNLFKDGGWKTFWSGTHCDCECHSLLLTDDERRKRERNYLLKCFLPFPTIGIIGMLTFIT